MVVVNGCTFVRVCEPKLAIWTFDWSPSYHTYDLSPHSRGPYEVAETHKDLSFNNLPVARRFAAEMGQRKR